jgi:hypothetical protein
MPTTAGQTAAPSTPSLPFSLAKVKRMLRIVRTNQFVSFTE